MSEEAECHSFELTANEVSRAGSIYNVPTTHLSNSHRLTLLQEERISICLSSSHHVKRQRFLDLYFFIFLARVLNQVLGRLSAP